MKTIAVAGTFDTKGYEFLYVKKLIEETGLRAYMIHAGVYEPVFEPEVSNRELAAEAGVQIEELIKKNDRGRAMEVLSKGLEKLLPILYKEGKFDGILSLGGSGGTALVAPAMRSLPIGVPKVMVSTMASGDVSRYVGNSDIVMIPSVVDICGMNSISRKIFANAVSSVVGMVSFRQCGSETEKPLIAATMFGVTTPCVTHAREYLERKGYEVLVFHATGAGGRAMESLIYGGAIKGVLDLTTTEWCDELFGGIFGAGPHRNEAAALCGIPQVVSVGAMDMVNFGPYDEVPSRFAGRNLYKHNPMVTLMRTTYEENVLLGRKLAEKLNLAKEKTVLLLPLKGVSAMDQIGEAFYGPKEDQALFETLTRYIDLNAIPVTTLDCNINDPVFAETAADILIRMIESEGKCNEQNVTK